MRPAALPVRPQQKTEQLRAALGAEFHWAISEMLPPRGVEPGNAGSSLEVEETRWRARGLTGNRSSINCDWSLHCARSSQHSRQARGERRMGNESRENESRERR